MSPESQPIIELITARTRQLQLLAAELLQSRQALVRLDLDAIHNHNAQQETLCQEVMRLDGQLLRLSNAGGLGPAGQSISLNNVANTWDHKSREELGALLKEHDKARVEVQDLSQVQADLLRRSRRYLRILFNLVSNSMGQYEAPKLQPFLAGGGN
jgi:hypothetical protein